MCVSRTVFFWPHAVNTAAGAAPDTPPAAAQEQAAGKEAQPRSPLFEALEIRASEEAARQIAGTGDVTNPDMAWDRERAFAGMERLRAEIVMLSGLHGAQRELLQWNRERIKTGRAPALLPAAPLPGDGARRLVPVAAGNLRRGRPGRRRRPPCPPPCRRLPRLKTPRRTNPETD